MLRFKLKCILAYWMIVNQIFVHSTGEHQANDKHRKLNRDLPQSPQRGTVSDANLKPLVSKKTRAGDSDDKFAKPLSAKTTSYASHENTLQFNDHAADPLDNVILEKPLNSQKTYINLEQYMRNLTRTVGTKAVFYCDILGQPIPQFQWFKNTKKLSEGSDRIRIETGLWGSSLRVEHIKKSDEGAYICVATNPSGTINATAYLEVVDKATPMHTIESRVPNESVHGMTPERDGFCQEFHSNVCGKYLFGHKVYVTREYQQALLETQISKFLKFTAIQPIHQIREECLRKLMEAVCYYNFPVCLPVHDPDNIHSRNVDHARIVTNEDSQSYQPLYLCRQDCQSVMENECSSMYKYLERTIFHEVPEMLMNCAQQPRYTIESPNSCRSIGQSMPTTLEDTLFYNEDDESVSKTNENIQKSRKANAPSHEQGGSKADILINSLSTGPDLVPLFISVGVLLLLGFLFLTFCFCCRRSWHNSARLEADRSGLFSRPHRSSGFGRLNGNAFDSINGSTTRGSGAGGPKEYGINKKRNVPGMGSHIKKPRKGQLLTGPDDAYTIAFSTRNNSANPQSDSSNNLTPNCIPISKQPNSLSSGPNSQIALTNDASLSLTNQVSDLNHNLRNGCVVTYHQYQPPNCVLPPLPPPNAPAPPPPPDFQTCSNGFVTQPIFTTTPTLGTRNFSSYPLEQHSMNQLRQAICGVDNVNTESPTVYTTLRESSSNGIFANQSSSSFTRLNDLSGDGATSKADSNEHRINPVQYSLSQLRFGKQFGQGVFGPVYKAELLQNGTYENGSRISIIVKTLSSGSPATLQADFRREAELIAELDHPNVLNLFGVNLQQPPWCMIFEVRQYLDLCEMLAARRATDSPASETDKPLMLPSPLNHVEKLHILGQVAAGMDYLSSHRFVHRDLAARNVLIMNDQLFCKITDLGLARDCYASDYYRLHRQSLMLPIRWMPLDSIIYGKFTVESDVWAFGVLMWEVWTGGMRPYGNYADEDVLELIRVNTRLHCPQDSPPEVYNFMTACWNEETDKRPSFKDCLYQISCWQYNMTASEALQIDTSCSNNISPIDDVRNSASLGNFVTPAECTRLGDGEHLDENLISGILGANYFSQKNPVLFASSGPMWFNQYLTESATTVSSTQTPGDENHSSVLCSSALSPNFSNTTENGQYSLQFNGTSVGLNSRTYRGNVTLYHNHSPDVLGASRSLSPHTAVTYVPEVDSVL